MVNLRDHYMLIKLIMIGAWVGLFYASMKFVEKSEEKRTQGRPVKSQENPHG